MHEIWSQLKSQVSNIIPEKNLLNRYVITGVAFFVWMIFFDKNKWINQFQLSQSIHRLEKEKENLKKQIVEAQKDKMDLDQNKEKYAREKYYMHKENEDLFIFEESLKTKQ